MIRLIKRWLRRKFGKKVKRCDFCGKELKYAELLLTKPLCEKCNKLFLESLNKNCL